MLNLNSTDVHFLVANSTMAALNVQKKKMSGFLDEFSLRFTRWRYFFFSFLVKRPSSIFAYSIIKHIQHAVDA